MFTSIISIKKDFNCGMVEGTSISENADHWDFQTKHTLVFTENGVKSSSVGGNALLIQEVRGKLVQASRKDTVMITHYSRSEQKIMSACTNTLRLKNLTVIDYIGFYSCQPRTRIRDYHGCRLTKAGKVD